MDGKGTLYGVSVGPGDTELLTLKALRILQDCPVLAAPRTPGGGRVALDIVAGAIDPSEKELLELDFAMAHDDEARAACHERAAALLRQPLEQRRSVAMLCLGDVGLYGSFGYVAQLLESDFPIERIPGVTSFCAAAARLGINLAEGEEPLHLLPGGAEYVPGPGTRVYMKSGRKLGDLLCELEQRGALDRAVLVQNCGMEDERVFYGAGAKEAPHSYFSIVLVKE